MVNVFHMTIKINVTSFVCVTADQYPRDRKTQCVKSPHGTLQVRYSQGGLTLHKKVNENFSPKKN